MRLLCTLEACTVLPEGTGPILKQPEPGKAYYYIDESGDPRVIGRKGKDLLASGTVSPVFMVGYLETSTPRELSDALDRVGKEIADDEYLSGIPSVSSSKVAFHANKDCAEVRERVFRALNSCDFKVFAVVARKNADQFRKRFDLKDARLYEYLVRVLLENRLHLHEEIDVYFAEMGNIVRRHTMEQAIGLARQRFSDKWGALHANSVRVFVQQASQLRQLQAVDYVLWAVYQVYSRKNFRYYHYLIDKISMVQDVFDAKRYPKTYYTRKNPLTPEIVEDPVDG